LKEARVALVRVKDNQTGEETTVSEEWLTRWPDDFTEVKEPSKPSNGTPVKEK
jgi:hypothetical protein